MAYNPNLAKTYQAKVMDVELSTPTSDNPMTTDRDEGNITRVMISVDILLKEQEATKLYALLQSIIDLDRNVYLVV